MMVSPPAPVSSRLSRPRRISSAADIRLPPPCEAPKVQRSASTANLGTDEPSGILAESEGASSEDGEEEGVAKTADSDGSSENSSVPSSPSLSVALSSPDIDLPIQIHSRPNTPLLPLILSLPVPLIDEDTGSMDDAVERHFLNEARELGVEVPLEPADILPSTLDSGSTVTVSSGSPDTQTIPSRASESTRPTSRGSSIQNSNVRAPATKPTKEPQIAPAKSIIRIRQPTRTASLSSISIFHERPASSSAPSSNSQEAMSSSRLAKGFKRFSNYTKRRTMMLNKSTPILGDTSMENSVKDTPETTMNIKAVSSSQIDAVELEADEPAELPDTAPAVRSKPPIKLPDLTEDFSQSSPPSPQSTAATKVTGRSGPRPDDRKASDATGSEERSLRSRHLQAIRMHQLDEQSEFLEYYSGSIDKLRARYIQEREAAEEDLRVQQKTVEIRYNEQHAEMEDRHLAREIDLTRAMEQERQACATKLKHMDAYCNGRQSKGDPTETPRRQVTEDDYRKLLQQYHVQQTMGSLHESRIKVLREKQARQMERLESLYHEELEVLQERCEAEEEKRQASQAIEEDKLRSEFDLNKHRLIWRWKLMEVVERHKLGLEKGEAYGPLPAVPWGEDSWLQAPL